MLKSYFSKQLTVFALLCSTWQGLSAAPLDLPLIKPVAGNQALNAEQLLLNRSRLDQALWSPEVEAQQHEAVFTKLWDDLLKVHDKFSILAGFPFTTLVLGKPESREELDLQIGRIKFSAANISLTPEKWYELLRIYRTKGYQIEHTEWHHGGFTPASKGLSAKSEVSMTIHAFNPGNAHRVIIRGQLLVDWSSVKRTRWRPHSGDYHRREHGDPGALCTGCVPRGLPYQRYRQQPLWFYRYMCMT